MPETPDFVTIGEIVGAHGVRGELRLTMLSDFPQRFLALQRVYLAPPPAPAGARAGAARPAGAPQEYRLLTARLIGPAGKRFFPIGDPEDAARSGPWAGQVHQALVKLAGVNDRETADALRGALLQLPASEAWPLPPDTYYAFQLYDLPVITEAGRTVGVVADLIATGSNDVYLVRNAAGKELLVPAIKEIVLEINPSAGYIRIKDPAAWMDEEDQA